MSPTLAWQRSKFVCSDERLHPDIRETESEWKRDCLKPLIKTHSVIQIWTYSKCMWFEQFVRGVYFVLKVRFLLHICDPWSFLSYNTEFVFVLYMYLFCTSKQSLSLPCVCIFSVLLCRVCLNLCSVYETFCPIMRSLSLLCVCVFLSYHAGFVFALCVRLFCHIV